MEKLDPSDVAAPVNFVEDRLRAGFACYDGLDPQARRSLLAAEYLLTRIAEAGDLADLTRPAAFSYCYAVEIEAKNRLGARMKKFADDPATAPLIHRLLEPGRGRLSIFFERYLLRSLRSLRCEATPDNFFQTFRRMLDHGPRYRPDGLKALGIIVMSFGRFYSFRGREGEIEIYNPLRFSGLTDSDAVLAFGVDLVNLQHARNPFVHPEPGEPEPLDLLRSRALSILRTLERL